MSERNVAEKLIDTVLELPALDLDALFDFDCLGCGLLCCADQDFAFSLYAAHCLSSYVARMVQLPDFAAPAATPWLSCYFGRKSAMPCTAFKMVPGAIGVAPRDYPERVTWRESVQCPLMAHVGSVPGIEEHYCGPRGAVAMCLGYDHRPITCRLYPLGRRTMLAPEDSGEDVQEFFMTPRPGCPGVGIDNPGQTVRTYLAKNVPDEVWVGERLAIEAMKLFNQFAVEAGDSHKPNRALQYLAPWLWGKWPQSADVHIGIADGLTQVQYVFTQMAEERMSPVDAGRFLSGIGVTPVMIAEDEPEAPSPLVQ